MRGWSSIIVGLALLALAACASLAGLFLGATITLGLAGAFLIYRGLQGVGVTDAGDPTALGDFISNPAGSLIEAATGQAEEWLAEKRKAPAEEPPRFDADAALARYIANRPAPPPQAGQASPPVRGFGRKRL
jgi:hypothetical protein